MALTGIEIFKMLPKTNCKECGLPTCLAFAMALASGKAELDACPYVSDEAKEKLAAASAPPIRPVKLAMKEGVKTIGGETVMFRHEKTFFNPTIIAGLVTTAAPDAEVDAKLAQFMKLQYDRVGLLLRPEMIAIKDMNGDAGKVCRPGQKGHGQDRRGDPALHRQSRCLEGRGRGRQGPETAAGRRHA